MLGGLMFSWEWMREIEGKEDALLYWFGIAPLNQRICYFPEIGKDMGKRRGPCKSESTRS